MCIVKGKIYPRWDITYNKIDVKIVKAQTGCKCYDMTDLFWMMVLQLEVSASINVSIGFFNLLRMKTVYSKKQNIFQSGILRIIKLMKIY